jgi:hypothetical protein
VDPNNRGRSAAARNAKIVPANCGYTYNHPETGEKMREYLVDTCNLFQERMNAQTPFGGNRSVRYPEGRMLMIWGHNEAIVKQFTLTSKSWVGTNGETAIVPKDDGCGIMITAFQSREFGFGLEISKEDMARVNTFRKDQVYKDEAAAKAKHGDSKKSTYRYTICPLL